MATESQEQMTFVEMCNWHPILRDYVWHNANQSKRTRWYGNQLVRMGLKKGVADITIGYPVLPYHGMFIEFKSDNGRLTKEQWKFLHNQARVGYATHIAYSADDAWNVAMQYLDGKFEQRADYDAK